MTVLPKLEPLEDRIVFAGADPDVTIAGPDSVELGQQDVGYTLTFDNTGTDSGYVPYVDLIIPTSGADGEGDGPSFDSASFLGAPINTTELVFDAAGEVEHPFVTNPDGSPFIVTGGLPGDTLVVFELPYGSFSPGNPPVDIDVVIDLSDQADLGAMPTFTAIGGFAFGCDPFDNQQGGPGALPPDLAVRGSADTFTSDPTLFEVTKVNNGPEEEGATGPSYVYQYTLTVDVAPGQTLDNFTLTDNLPPEIVYLGNLNISGGVGGSATTEPIVGAQVGVGEQLIVDFSSVSGTVNVTFDYYISNDPSGTAAPTNDPTTGAPAPVVNTVTGDGDWTPLDTDDAPQSVSDSDSNTITASTLAIQKSNAVFEDNNAPGASPGDVYEFTVNVQVSDYFSYGDLSVQDILGDGWVYEAGSAEFFVVEEAGNLGSASSRISLTSNETVVDDTPGLGQTEVTWDISQAMIDAGGDGLLIGDIAGDGASSGTQTTVTITYRAEIRSEFENTGSGEVEIGQGDRIQNDVTVSGDVRGNPDDGADPNIPTGNVLTNDGSSGVTIARGAIDAKEVFALNGDPNPPTDIVIAAGDTVTFAVTYTAPLAAFEDFRIEDNFPQLVFDAASEFNPATTWVAAPADRDAPPAAGTAYFGSGTSAALLGLVPTITTDGPNNGLIFDFGDFTAATPAEAVIEILVTATVQDALFAPELLLTNQATAFETNTFGEEISSTAIAQFSYGEPNLNITKGVVGTDATDPETTITGSIGLSGVTVPDASSPRFTGVVNSGAANGSPIDVDANITAVDSGDVVTFAIVLENEGIAPNGAFNVLVQDSLPAGFIIPTGPNGLNLSVTDGAGNTIPFTLPDETVATPADLFGAGLLLTDDGPLQGAISAFDATSGENVVVITYDLEVDGTTSPNTTLTNTASIATYNAFEGNGQPLSGGAPVNRVITPLTDDATATTETIEIDKSIETRQFDGDITRRGANEVAVGEDFTFLVRVDVPEGTLFNTVISDSVTNGGLTLLSAEIVTMGANMTAGTGLVQGDTVAATGGTDWSFNFGDLVNSGDNDPNNDFIEIRVFARASDADVGPANHLMRNVAQIEFENAGGDTTRARDGQNVRLIEPQLDLEKSASPAVVDADSRVSYEVDIDNPTGFRDAPAFDLTLSDVLDPVLTLDTGSITILLNGTPQVPNGTDFAITTNVGGDPNAFEVFIDRLDQGDTIQVRYEADVDPGVASGLTIPNTANLVFDSTPEDDSGADGDDREYSLTDNAQVQTAEPELTKEVVAGSTSYNETSGTDLGIGEELTYRFTVVIPEGATDSVVLTDTLPAGLEHVSSSVVSIGAQISGSVLNPGDPGSHASPTTTFNFGNLTNASDGVTDAGDEVVVEIRARVTDSAAVSGDTLTNTGTLSFVDGNGNPDSVADTADITIVEPDVGIDKSVSPTTADAGDTVTYTIRAENSGTGPAYDMRITDDVVGPEVTALGTATIVIEDGSGGTYTPTGVPSFSFNGSGELEVIVPDLPADHVVIITYDAVVEDAALFSSTYTNTATVARYDSNPDGDAFTPPADPNAEERTYTGPSDTADITTPDASVAKAIFGSDNTDTSGSNLNVGELVTYRLTITAPQGTADIVLTDNLPSGLLAQSARVVAIGDDVNDTSTTLTNTSNDGNTGNITINGSRDLVTFDFGTVVVDGSDNGATPETTIVVEVVSLVADVGGIDAGDPLVNTANLTVSDPGGGVVSTDTATETVTVTEPELVVAKTGPVGADPGEIVSYSITLTNTGTGPAYDTTVTDDFADGNLNYQTGTAQVFVNGSLLAPAPTIVEPAPAAADGFQVQGLTLQPGDVVRVDFDVELDAAAPEAQTFINTANVAYDSVDGAPLDADGNPRGRDDTASDDHRIATVPFIEKTPFASQLSETDSVNGSDPFELAIGEEVTYRYQITLPEIALDSVIATDTLPPGLEFVSASVVAVNGTGAAGTVTATPDGVNPNQIELDFGAMTNPSDGSIGADDILVFEVVARVTTLANAGDTLTNSVDLDVDPSGAGPFATQTTTADVEIVEPSISIDKTGPLALSPGGAAGTFQVVITNDGIAGAEGPAYDLDITDTMPAGLTLDPGSFTFATGGGATLTPETFTANTSTFLAEFPVLDVGEQIVITYEASLNAGATPLDTFVNTASADYFSAPDNLLNNAGGVAARDYAPVTDNHTVNTIPTLDKTAISTGTAETPQNADADTELDATIGETVTYELTLTLPEIPLDALDLTDSLPTGMTFVSAEVTAIGTEISVNGSTDLSVINAGATINTVGQDTTLNLANVVNTANGSISAVEDTITVAFTARVSDDPSLVGSLPNSLLTNNASLVITPQGEAALTAATASETIEVVEPNLVVDKTGTPAVNPGDTVTYQVQITNNGTSPAFDVIVSDSFGDPNLTLDTGTVTIDLDGSNLTANVNVTEAAGGFSFELDNNATGDPFPIPVGGVLTVTYDATLSASAPEAQTFQNTASIAYDNLPGDPLDENGNPVDDRDYTASDVNSVATVPFLTKTPFASNVPETDSTNGSNPFQLTIGEEVTYRYELYLPEIDMDSVIFEDTLDPGLEYVGFNVVSFGDNPGDFLNTSGGAPAAPVDSVISQQNFVIDFGDLRNPEDTVPPTIGTDDIITLEVTARVTNDGAASAGDTLNNSASLQVDPTAGNPLREATADASVDIVEPRLEIDKTGPSLVAPGDTANYVLTITNVGDPAGPGPAFDIEINDALPPGLTLNVGTVNYTVGGAPASPTSETITTSGFTATFDTLAVNEVIQVTYSATLSASVPTVSSFLNAATADYDSAPGDPLDGDGNPAEQTYAPVSDDHVFSTGPDLDKIAASSEFSQTDFDADGDGFPDLAIGEAMTYQLVITLPDIAMDSVVLTDTLPSGLDFVSASIASVGTEVSINGSSSVSNSGQVVTVSLTDVVNVFGDTIITTAEDAIVVEVVARVSSDAANVSGRFLTNSATLDVTPTGLAPLPTETATSTVEVIEPDVSISKATTADEPTPGDTFTYTFVITNDAAATGPAFNTVLSDPLPLGLTLTGNTTLSDPSLGTVSTGAGADNLVVNIPVLQPGEELTVTAEVLFSFNGGTSETVTNTASFTSATTPVAGNPNGRSYSASDSAQFEADLFVPVFEERAAGQAIGGIDDAQFLPILLIDPIFTGTAEPGSNVTVNLYRQDGTLDYVRNIVADTGGHWIAIFPRVQLNSVADDFSEEYAGSVLFDEPVRYLDSERSDVSFGRSETRELSVGADLLDEAYTLGVSVDRPSTLPQDVGIFNTRTYFAPAHVGEVYGIDDVITVDEIFQDLAFKTVEGLYNASADPLGLSLNRFNHEFLGAQTAVPGAQ